MHLTRPPLARQNAGTMREQGNLCARATLPIKSSALALSTKSLCFSTRIVGLSTPLASLSGTRSHSGDIAACAASRGA